MPLYKWPSEDCIAQIARSVVPDIDIHLIHTSEIPNTIAMLRRWYPAIEVGAESRYLSSEFFLNNCTLRGFDSSHNILPVIVSSNEQNIGFMSFELNAQASQLTSSLGVVNPEFRGKGIGYLGPQLLEAVALEMKIAFIYYFVTLENIMQQKIAEKLGFQLIGIFPSWDRDLLDGKPQRVSEAVYAKSLPTAERLRSPNPENLTEKTKALWQHLFGELTR